MFLLLPEDVILWQAITRLPLQPEWEYNLYVFGFH
jgi:hypothetical protein